MASNNSLRLVQPDNNHDGKLHIARGVAIHPDRIIGDGNGVLGVGMPGSGKTTLLALLLEQFGKCDIPFVAFDLEGDLASVVSIVPRGLVATRGNCPSAKDIYEKGLQVVIDLQSWEDDTASLVAMMTSLSSKLLHIAKSTEKKVPFIVALDEAAYWLPQQIGGKRYLSKEQFQDLYTTFHGIALRGRKQGLSLFLFTQRFANVSKDVLVGTGTFFLMKQTMKNDLDCCLDYVGKQAWGEDGNDLSLIQVRNRISNFRQGQAAVKFLSGKQYILQFNNRESEHTSTAPKTSAAIDAYHDIEVDDEGYGPYEVEEETEITTITQEVLEVAGTAAQRAREFFAKDPSMRNAQLYRMAGCDPSTASRVRRAYFAAQGAEGQR